MSAKFQSILELTKWKTNSFETLLEENNQVIIGVVAISFMQTGAPFYYSVPDGMEQVVMYYKERYNNTPIYITENGMASFC